MQQSVKEGASFSGIYTITKTFLETEEQQNLDRKITLERNKGNNILPLIRKLNKLCKTEIFTVKNILPTAGRTMIMNNLTSATPTNAPLVNKAELGTGTTTPANTDTGLAIATYRNVIASVSNINNVGYVSAFFTATEISGTFSEMGIFSNGGTALGSGVLVSRVLASIVKTTAQTLTFDWTVSLN